MSDDDSSVPPPPPSQGVKRIHDNFIANEKEILRRWQIDSLQSFMPEALNPESFSPALVGLLVQIARITEVDAARKQLELTILERRETEDLFRKRIKKRTWLTPADCKGVLREHHFRLENRATEEPPTGAVLLRAALSGGDHQTPNQHTPRRSRTRRASTISSSSASSIHSQRDAKPRLRAATFQQKAVPEQRGRVLVGKVITVAGASMSDSSSSSSIPNTRTLPNNRESPDFSYGSRPEDIAKLLKTKNDMDDTPPSPNLRQSMGQNSSSPQGPRKTMPQPRQSVAGFQTPQPSSSAANGNSATTNGAPNGIFDGTCDGTPSLNEMRPPCGRTSSVPRDRTSSVPRDRASSVFHRTSPGEDNIKRKWIELASEIEQEVIRLDAQVRAQTSLLECLETDREEVDQKHDFLKGQISQLEKEYETIAAESVRLQERLPDVTMQLEGILADLFPGEKISKAEEIPDVETPGGAVTQTLATFRNAVEVKARAREKIGRQLEVAKSSLDMAANTLAAKEEEIVEVTDLVEKLEQDLDDLKVDANILKKRRHD
ncbi:hypothetical protein B0T25DRAFT_578867 [Lasiosphaeria hispida]|uniref:Uncharacterized protein n=1 Tax=Lasiosphaeria hispida TaxID=260671 RepID=A0AAJ0MFF0_9PEZI|nr:hypothetical protein B0T25DRAFT_578867 [Lasiosphaeria hispida]